MFVDFLLSQFKILGDDEAIIWNDVAYSYGWLLGQVKMWEKEIENIDKGSVVVIDSDFSPNSIALFLSLIEKSCIIVPIFGGPVELKDSFMEIVRASVLITINDNDVFQVKFLDYDSREISFYKTLREKNHPGIVLFSSGSTGKNKAAVHDFIPLLEKFKVSRKKFRTIMFLLYDHIGGINTMLYTLSNGGCLIIAKKRTPNYVLSLIEKYKAELLPTSPTFINLILLSKEYKNYALDSLKVITYGTEPMLESTLSVFCSLFPNIKLLQTYGLSEVGILPSKSKNSNSLWLKIGGGGFDIKIIDNILYVKSQSAMLGYINAPSPFTEDGWFNTEDVVELDGEYMRILGRKSEIINVGGEKVFPAEVESVIQEFEGVGSVVIYSEPNAIIGNVVCADVELLDVIDETMFIRQLKYYCRTKLQRYKIPVKINVVKDSQHNERFKKIRKKNV